MHADTYRADTIKGDFESTADWRRKKAIEFPNDDRNPNAAKLLDRLAETVKDVDPALMTAYAELFDDHVDSEKYAEMLREIGFHRWPNSATEFVKDFIANRTS